MANYQAFRTRRVKSVLSESKFIAITVVSITQAALVGLPVLLLVEEEPRAHYVVQVLLVFCVCMAVIGFIFIPKVMANGSAVDTLDARSSNIGASLRDSMRVSTGGAVNDTVAQIRVAAAETSRIYSTDQTEEPDPEGAPSFVLCDKRTVEQCEEAPQKME